MNQESSIEDRETGLASIVSSLQSLLSSLENLITTNYHSLLPVTINYNPYSQLAQISGSGSGLVAHYTFDEGTGATANDSTTDDGAQNGTLTNGPTWVTGTDAKVGSGALSFDGVNDYVNVTHTTLISPPEITIAFWLNPATSGIVKRIIDKSTGGYLIRRLADNRMQFVPGFYNSITIAPSNKWAHVTITASASGHKWYINGVADFSNTVAYAPSGTQNLQIGGILDFFSGSLDDVRIYSRALTLPEIQQLFALGTSVSFPINGSCGPAAKTYTSSESFPQGSYCTTGTAFPSFHPQDPTSQTPSSWQCQGSNGGTIASCTATRAAASADTTQPIISSIQSSNITQTQATILWQTNEPADSQLDYGLTTSYGSQTTLDSTLQTSHSQTISTLQANTTYHYRVRSKDQVGNPVQSGDQTFVTAPVPVTGNIFYIRDGATGTTCTDWTNTCDTLPATLQRGATYYIADGSYGAYTFDDLVDGTKTITIKKATIGDHGADMGWQDGYGDGVAEWSATMMFRTDYIAFDGVSGGGAGKWDSTYGFKITSPDNVIFVMFSDKFGSPSSRVNVSHITISHIELAGRFPVTPGWGDGFNATAYQANTSQVTISDCYVHDIGGLPFRFLNASDITVDGCYIARNASSAEHHGTAFRMDNVDGLILRDSLFEDIVGTGFVGGYDIGIDDVKIYGNVFRWTPNFNGETNVVADGGYGNGVIYSIGASGPITNWKIYNNTFFHLPDTSPIINLNNAGAGNEAYNNIFSDFAGPPFYNGVTLHDYNYFSIPGGTYSEVHSQNAGNTNPFINWQNKDFRLLNGTSPGINLGTQYSTDAYSNIRGTDGVWDRGAYEFVSNASTADCSLTNIRCVDDTSGSTQEYSTIQACANAAVAGDTCQVYPGTYVERVSSKFNGLAGQYISFIAQGAVNLQGGFVINNSYIKVDGFRIMGAAPNYQAYVDVRGSSSYCLITNNTIEGDGSSLNISGINLNKGTSYCTVQSNTLKNLNYPNSNVYGDHHLIVGNTFRDTAWDALRVFGHDHTISRNFFNHIDETTVTHTDIIQTFGDNGDVAYNIVFESNYVKDSRAQIGNFTQDGIADIRDWTFRNNIYENMAFGASIYAPHFKFYNNTFYNVSYETKSYALQFEINENTPGTNRGDYGDVKNNIFVDGGTDSRNSLYYVESGIVGFIGDYNYIVGAPPTWAQKTNWTDVIEPNGINGGDPKFVYYVNHDFRLRSDSPAINRGANLSSAGFSIDTVGTPRPQGSAWDIGAYEYNSGGTSLPTPYTLV